MRSLQLAGLVLCSFLISCRSVEKDKPISEPLPPTVSAIPAAPPSGTIVPQPSSQLAIPSKKQRQAPDRYEMVVPRIGWPVQSAYSNLIYEGNNLVVRQSPKSKVATRLSGEEIAKRWRQIAASTRKVFVLRDALFSQQDHAFDHDPYALMLPPSWLSIATAAALEKTALRPMTLPAESDDPGWAKADIAVVFGSFPISQSLFDRAKSPISDPISEDTRRAVFARKALQDLSIYSTELVQAQARGADAVAILGAERISAGDRLYFGEDLRRARVIPISVENPNEHEIRDEGKGFLPPEKRDISPQAVELTRKTVLRRRLADGDLALERYDISKPEDRQRAIHVLQDLIPKGELGPSLLWLWVNGPLDSQGTGGKNAMAYVEAFRKELAKANIELSRLRLFSKPHVEIADGEAGKKTLEDAILRFRKQDVWLSVNLGTAALDAHLR